jgi:hypothetical protein
MLERKTSRAWNMRNDYPSHWLPGQLLDLKRYADGSFRATLLGEEFKPELGNAITFESSYEAQEFVSTWYLPAAAREQHAQET